MGYTSDDERWAAVAGNDPAADGAFVYAVATTGVFCRPSCRARLPRRENVRYFAAPEDARLAGFRACKLCSPEGADDRDAALVRRATELIASAETPPRLEELAAAVGLSASQLRRVFVALTGVTPREYAETMRAHRLREGLSAGERVSDAGFSAGFGSGSRLYASTPKALGMTPSAFAAGGRGERIRFGTGTTSLGVVLVAATERGVCAIELGDDAVALEAALRERFSAAELVADDPAFTETLAAALAAVDEPGRGAGLPLDIRGTAFQRRVWDALRAIPAGTTTTYAQLAEKVGVPRGARAIARACASNTIAVVVPCHRVIRGDGDLSGYRWGVERKRTLLAREAAQKGAPPE